jgi:hypothetical protein
MAFTQADVDRLDRAIASGELLVRIDDKEIRFHSAVDMLQRRAAIVAIIKSAANPNRVVPRHQLADFSDE